MSHALVSASTSTATTVDPRETTQVTRQQAVTRRILHGCACMVSHLSCVRGLALTTVGDLCGLLKKLRGSPAPSGGVPLGCKSASEGSPIEIAHLVRLGQSFSEVDPVTRHEDYDRLHNDDTTIMIGHNCFDYTTTTLRLHHGTLRLLTTTTNDRKPMVFILHTASMNIFAMYTKEDWVRRRAFW